MKLSKKIIVLMGAIIVSGMIFTGCSNGNQTTSSQTSAVSSQESSQTSSATSEPADSSSSVSVAATPNSSASSNLTASDPSDAEFNAHFEKNPITAAHNEETMNVYTTTDMLQVEEKFAGIWSKEVDNAYEQCQSKLPADVFAAIKTTHEAWLSTQHADLADIRADGQQQGGTLGAVQIATKSAEYYQNEAKLLYKALYQNNIAYTYQYQS